MNKATVTKTINKVNERIELSKTDSFYRSSLGFQRLVCLPAKSRNDFDLAANLLVEDSSVALYNQISFLNGLTDQEFINWLTLN